MNDRTPDPVSADPGAWTFNDTFQVNTTTTNDQQDAAVTVLSDGGFVITWNSRHLSGSNWEIMGQRHDPTGTPEGAEFTVSGGDDGSEIYSSVTALANGGYVVTWHNGGVDGSPADVEARIFDASGTPGNVFTVNTTLEGQQELPAVTDLADGGFLITWMSFNQQAPDSGWDVQGQRFDTTGAPVGGEFLVNAVIDGPQGIMSAAGLENGTMVVTYATTGQDGSSTGIHARLFDNDGIAGPEFQVNTETYATQTLPSVAELKDGGFVITWASIQQDGSHWGIYGQRFAADGSTSGEEFLVNTTTENQQLYSSVTGLADGGFVVAFNSFGSDGWTLLGQRFDASGAAVDGEFVLREGGNNIPGFTSHVGGENLSALPDGGFVAAWSTWNADGSRAGVFARTVNGDGIAEPMPDPTPGFEEFIDPDGNIFTAYADGSETAQFVDGTFVTQNTDGTTERINPDGTHYFWDVDGVETETLADGTVKVTDVEGNTTATFTDGASGFWGRDGSSWIQDADGNIERSHADGSGSWEQVSGAAGAYATDGREIFVDAGGTTLRATADGSLDMADARIDTGTSGADTFRFSADDGALVIRDFDAAGGDRLVIEGRSADDLVPEDDGFADWHVMAFSDGDFLALIGVSDPPNAATEWLA